MRHHAAAAVAVLALASNPFRAAAQERLSPPPSLAGPGVQLYAFASGGWTVRETDPVENRVTDVELGSGAGLGASLTYHFTGWIGAYAGAEFGAEREGVYGSYGGGVLLRTARRGAVRFHGRLGARIIDVVAALPYADLGLRGELFMTPALALAADLTAEVPLGSGSRHTGLRRVEVSPRGGPERISLGISWYPSR